MYPGLLFPTNSTTPPIGNWRCCMQIHTFWHLHDYIIMHVLSFASLVSLRIPLTSCLLQSEDTTIFEGQVPMISHSVCCSISSLVCCWSYLEWFLRYSSLNVYSFNDSSKLWLLKNWTSDWYLFIYLFIIN